MDQQVKKAVEYIKDKKGIHFVRMLHSSDKTYLYLGHLPEEGHAGKKYVVKFILPGFVESFANESKIASRLNHRNIVRYEASERLDPKIYGVEKYIITDYVDGPTLRKLVSKLAYINHKITVGQAITIIKEVLVALSHIHNQKDKNGNLLNIVYKDVSPNNVIISTEGEVKLFDFGISSVGEENQLGAAGTGLYASPEVLEDKGSDQRSDIYSVTALLATLLSRSLYQKNTIQELKKSGLDTDLIGILEKGTSLDSSKRFQDTEGFIRALDEYLHSKNILVYTNEIRDLVKLAITSDDQSTFFQTSPKEPIQNVASSSKTTSNSSTKKPPIFLWGLLTGLAALIILGLFYKPHTDIEIQKIKTKNQNTLKTNPVNKDTNKELESSNTISQKQPEFWGPKIKITSEKAKISVAHKDNTWSETSTIVLNDLNIPFSQKEANFTATISRNGFKSKSFNFKLSPEKNNYQRTITLEKLQYGEITIGTSPLGLISIKNVASKKAGRLNTKIPTGSHTIIVKWEGTSAAYKTIQIRPNQKMNCTARYSVGLKSIICK